MINKIVNFLKENWIGGVIGAMYTFIYNYLFPHCAWFIQLSSTVNGGCSNLAVILSYPFKLLNSFPFLGVEENFIWIFEYAIIGYILGAFIQSLTRKRRK